MEEKKITFKGSNKRLSEKEIEELKKEIELSKKQLKLESRVDAATLKSEFNC